MDQAKLNKFKQQLLQLKAQIMNGPILNARQDLLVPQEEMADETDMASSIIHQNVSVNIQQREFQKLRQIEDALARIENGTYGFCEECDEEISEKRLETFPWTTLCIAHAEEKEREGAHYSAATGTNNS